MEIRFGVNTCFAVKRWPRVEDWLPIVRDRLGVRLVQHSFDLVVDGADAESAATVGREVRAAGLEFHSTFTGLAAYSRNLLADPEPAGRAAATAWYEWAIDWTAAAGGRATGGHVGALSVRDWIDPARRRVALDSLRDSLFALAGAARGAGLDYLMVENLAAAREPSTMAMVRDLLGDGDPTHVPIRLCLDVGHMCVPGTSGADRDPYAWLRAFGPVAPVVQLQQSDAAGDHHWPFTPARNASGRIDGDRVLEALGQSGATACDLILEVIPAFEQDDGTVIDDLARSAEYWRTALARNGFATV